MYLVCSECGNTEKFYVDISVDAKLKVTKKGKETRHVYGARNDFTTMDNKFPVIYCGVCNNKVADE